MAGFSFLLPFSSRSHPETTMSVIINPRIALALTKIVIIPFSLSNVLADLYVERFDELPMDLSDPVELMVTRCFTA